MAEIPQELINKTYEAFNAASSSGKVRKGTNETTKAIERGKAKLVAVANDVSPPEIVAHLPVLCDERDIPFVNIPKKDELGKAAGLTVPTSAAAIVNPGKGKDTLTDLVKKIKNLGKGKKSSKKEERKSEKKESKEKAEEKSKKEEKKE
ncbi:MAG: 50S ribosomal protein L7Ae [Candidatus Undinarchaeales archaeon]